jgi:hypothetical protein
VLGSKLRIIIGTITVWSRGKKLSTSLRMRAASFVTRLVRLRSWLSPHFYSFGAPSHGSSTPNFRPEIPP